MKVLPQIQTQAKQDGRDILNLVLDTISGDTQERARVNADLAYQKYKDGFQARNEARAMEIQIQTQDKGARA